MTLLPFDISLLFALEIIGTVAFAASGAMVAMKKEMDIFGVVILALCTAVGGGVIRDLILGITPPNTFRAPVYAIVTIVTAVILFLPAVRRLLRRRMRLYDQTMLVMDALGLGTFTVVGVRTAYTVSDDHGLALLLFVGVITGVGGGALRDVLSGSVPQIFVKHFYACASLLGALACALLWAPLGENPAMVIGAVVVMVLRLLAARFRWNLPRATRDD